MWGDKIKLVLLRRKNAMLWSHFSKVNSVHEGSIVRLFDKLKQESDQNAELKKELDEYKVVNAELQQKINKLEVDKNDFKNERNELRRELEKIRKENALENDGLNLHLKNIVAENRVLQKKLYDLENKNPENEQENSIHFVLKYLIGKIELLELKLSKKQKQ